MPKNSYLLTEEGLKKVYSAFVQICRKPSPSKEEMGLCVGLTSDTIRKLIRRTGGVNRDTLERLCNGLGWYFELDLKENFDYELQEQGVFISDPSRAQSKRPKKGKLSRVNASKSSSQITQNWLKKLQFIPTLSLTILQNLSNICQRWYWSSLRYFPLVEQHLPALDKLCI